MTVSAWLRRYWRIPLIALLGAVLAFAGSFLVSPTYESSTRVLIRAKDTSFLTTSGQDLSSGTIVADGSLSKSLAETYAAMATSRTTAEAVVDRLALDAPRAQDDGIIASARRGLSWLYRCTKAFVTSGFCAEIDTRTAAISGVQEGVTAGQLGPNTGQGAGQPVSYVLEIGATGETAEQARAVTDAVADELVAAGERRFTEDIQRYEADLAAQVAAAEQDVAARTQAVTDFKNTNGLSTAEEQQVLAATSYDTLQNNLLDAQAQLADLQAQLASTEASLADTPQLLSNNQRIQTGRSDTTVESDATNPVWTALATQRDQVRAQLNGVQARIAQLQSQLAAASPTALNTAQGRLVVLQQDLDLARSNQADLTGRLQQARSTAVTGGGELTRIDTAALPAYPAAPKRYMYLLLGLVFGGLAGAALTWWARRRHTGPAGVEQNPAPSTEPPGGGHAAPAGTPDETPAPVPGPRPDLEPVAPARTPEPVGVLGPPPGRNGAAH
ncbi:GumC family protein [Nakamurella leprariae]|uniref:Polysaccharide chain length determinant N-terminal domain-containing protein n=1 Tax=Nakamurella leprariae TaxID=2803911 RepID=A0A939C0U5_9ACTN|nr:Wzz/FepE/Etk N-terminal domain-containing protein [Nakamurella leprariae]MBM9469151.1 hypothetical protein [Nakamurella leprariae]